MNQFLEKHKLPQFTPDEGGHLHSPVTIKDPEFIIKKPLKNLQAQVVLFLLEN